MRKQVFLGLFSIISLLLVISGIINLADKETVMGAIQLALGVAVAPVIAVFYKKGK